MSMVETAATRCSFSAHSQAAGHGIAKPTPDLSIAGRSSQAPGVGAQGIPADAYAET
jgi:hypothetical protein